MSTAHRFSGHLLQAGANNTGIEVPREIAEALGKRAPVLVTVNGFSYRGTIASMGGKFLISFSADRRKASGIQGGDAIEVILERDDQPRTVSLPPDLATALEAVPGAQSQFNALAPSAQKAHVTAVEGAKSPETRQRRIEKVVAALKEG